MQLRIPESAKLLINCEGRTNTFLDMQGFKYSSHIHSCKNLWKIPSIKTGIKTRKVMTQDTGKRISDTREVSQFNLCREQSIQIAAEGSSLQKRNPYNDSYAFSRNIGTLRKKLTIGRNSDPQKYYYQPLVKKGRRKKKRNM